MPLSATITRPQHNRLACTAVLFVCATLAGCDVRVTDQTTGLVYNAPLNQQRFAAQVVVQGSVRVSGVDLSLYGEAPVPMTESGGRWSTTLPVPACREVAEYTYTVHMEPTSGDGSIPSRTFPDVGAYRQSIPGQPPECVAHLMTFGHAFTVDSAEDLPDVVPGDGYCDASSDPKLIVCTLRAAIMESNTSRGSDLILLRAARYLLTRTHPGGPSGEADDAPDAAFGDLDITGELTIRGIGSANVIFDYLKSDPALSDYLADDPTRVAAVARIDGNRLDRVFQIFASGPAQQGFVGFENLYVRGGRKAATDQRGGGIDNRGTLALRRVTVGENSLGAGGAGAGIYNAGVLAISESAIVRNEIPGQGHGGGLFNAPAAEAGIERSFFGRNVARYGLAVKNADDQPGRSLGRMLIVSSTFWGNRATAAPGAAIHNQGDLTIRYATIAGNDRVGIQALSGSTVIENSVVANNGNDCVGTMVTNGNNIIMDVAACTLSAGLLFGPDLIGVDTASRRPALRLGFTPVIPVYRSDPGVDRISTTGSLFCLGLDQRGQQRPEDGDGDGTVGCDAGAYERRALDPD